MTAEQATPEQPENGAQEKQQRVSQATIMVRLARESGAEFWHTPDSECYATVERDGHRETFPLKGKAANGWLRCLYFEETGSAPSTQGVADALAQLRAFAEFTGEQRAVHVRTAAAGGTVYIDLGDESWRAVAITAEGWRVVSNPPVRFRRPPGMLPLPVPAAGGDVDLLRPFVNVAGDADFRLMLSWAVAALMPDGPYPVLDLEGEAGAAKTTAGRVLQALIDPNAAGLRAEPRQTWDLMLAGRNAQLVAYDNISHLAPWLSDALCRLATGGGIAKRELYTDDSEVLFAARRPVLLTGITSAATRGDLIDRSLRLALPAIPKEQRRKEAELWAEFEAVRRLVFGALLDALALALRERDHVELGTLPRMADFAATAAAAAPALGWTAAEFMEAYTGNVDTARADALEGSIVGMALVRFMAERERWEGTAGELLEELTALVDEQTAKRKEWPKTPHKMRADLARLATDLAGGAGVRVTFRERTATRRLVTLERVGEETSPTSRGPLNGCMEDDDVGDVSPAGDVHDVHPGGIRHTPRDPANGSGPPPADVRDVRDVRVPPPAGDTNNGHHPGEAPPDEWAAAYPREPREQGCPACCGTDFWTHQDGRKLCVTCHPPVLRGSR